MRLASTVVLVLTLSAISLAQGERPSADKPQGENLAVPEGWIVRLDRPDPAATVHANGDSTGGIYFVNMTPGWHITTRPSGIFYHPANTAEGNYRATMSVYLFDPGERNEAFGFFVGGTNLGASDLVYSYFLIRNSGEYLIKNRKGEQTAVVSQWTDHDSILTWGPSTEAPVKNILALEVLDGRARFLINNELVASLPAADLSTNGIVGMRVNHNLNLHIDDLSVSAIASP